MFNVFIDSFQNGKKQFVNTFVHNDKLKQIMLQFVDIQTEYTKAAVTHSINTSHQLGLFFLAPYTRYK